MGLFDSLMVTCPGCGQRDAIQIKPVSIEGEMMTYDIETAPEFILDRASYLEEVCGCGVIYRIASGHGHDGFVLQVISEFEIDNKLNGMKFETTTSFDPSFKKPVSCPKVDHWSSNRYSAWWKPDDTFVMICEGVSPQHIRDQVTGNWIWCGKDDAGAKEFHIVLPDGHLLRRLHVSGKRNLGS